MTLRVNGDFEPPRFGVFQEIRIEPDALVTGAK